jgi:hypothetical protein
MEELDEAGLGGRHRNKDALEEEDKSGPAIAGGRRRRCPGGGGLLGWPSGG